MHKKGLENRIRLFDERQCQATSLRLSLSSFLVAIMLRRIQRRAIIRTFTSPTGRTV